jgi:hypothetical protein
MVHVSPGVKPWWRLCGCRPSGRGHSESLDSAGRRSFDHNGNGFCGPNVKPEVIIEGVLVWFPYPIIRPP